MSKKQPKRALYFGKYEEAGASKIEVPAEPDTTFSFRRICQDKHSPSQCSYPQLKCFADKLRILTSASWSTIAGSSRTTNGYEIIPRKALNRTIPDGVPTTADILVFRFGGGSGSKNSGRMAGYKSGSTFYVLFVDSKLDLYKHD